MKKKFNAAISRQSKTVIDLLLIKRSARSYHPHFYLIMLLGTLVFAACNKNSSDQPAPGEQTTVKSNEIKSGSDLLKVYEGLNARTLAELQEAHAATAKYQNINNAFTDGYKDTAIVVLPNMGYHFLKPQLISPVFDLKKPAILVYNRKENGNFELVALEYAVPIDPQNTNTPPEGFSGHDDAWDFNTLNSGWWTLHAWVWSNNPDGVFKPMNPLITVR